MRTLNTGLNSYQETGKMCTVFIMFTFNDTPNFYHISNIILNSNNTFLYYTN